MKIPVVVIRVPLYDLGENEKPVPFSEEEVQEIFQAIQSEDDVMGYSIGKIELLEEEWDFSEGTPADYFEWDFSRMDDGVLIVQVEEVPVYVVFKDWIYCPGTTVVDYSGDHLSIPLLFTESLKHSLLEFVQENKNEGQGKFFWEK